MTRLPAVETLHGIVLRVLVVLALASFPLFKQNPLTVIGICVDGPLCSTDLKHLNVDEVQFGQTKTFKQQMFCLRFCIKLSQHDALSHVRCSHRKMSLRRAPKLASASPANFHLSRPSNCPTNIEFIAGTWTPTSLLQATNLLLPLVTTSVSGCR